MRREISGKKHWRSMTPSNAVKKSPWSARRHAHSIPTLPVEAIDAVFASAAEMDISDSDSGKTNGALAQVEDAEGALEHLDIIQNLSKQLVMLEAQQNQISRLLAQVQNP